jgi:Lrp/AsnC family transcriptional regulator, regulator for asnA, asnC and gidA
VSDAGDGSGRPVDALDVRIIAVLQRDPRAASAVIAQEVGLGEDEVERRIASLTEDGVIGVVAMTDPIQLGYARMAMIGVVVDGPLPPVVDALALDPYVIYLVRIRGGFHVMAEVVGRSDAHLLELVAKIRRLPGVTRIHTFLEKKLVKEDYTYGGVTPSEG